MIALRFARLPNNDTPIRLTFGETGGPGPPTYTVTIDATLPALAGDVAATFDPAVVSYLQRRAGAVWRDGEARQARAGAVWRDGEARQARALAAWRDGARVAARGYLAWRDAAAVDRAAAAQWRDGTAVDHVAATRWRDGTAVDHVAATRWRDGTAVDRSTSSSWRDAAAAYSTVTSSWREAAPFLAGVGLPWRAAVARGENVGLPWRDGTKLSTDGANPFVVDPVEPPDPCYIPSPANSVRLIFESGPAGTRLAFYCTRNPVVPPLVSTVVVPVRSVYIMLNTVTLVRATDSTPLVVSQFSMSLDVDSWTWSWNARMPGAMLPLIDVDAVTEVVATINGGQYRLLIESIGRERTFGTTDLRVSGRGRNALLDVQASTFSAPSARTAAQIMDEALQVNGVGIGWTVEFGLEDWLVPGGIWSHQGTPLSALRAVAAAGGGYLQPHPTGQIVRVLPRYAAAPWNWVAQITPDYELPSAATVREGIEWIKRPDYNRVFVSGSAGGVLAQITRAGTAGDDLAPMVTDSLITTVAAGRQRGLAILGDTGRQAKVSLRTLVFPSTGIIVPGKFVRYVDGATTRLGVVRRVQVDAQMPSLAQTLEVETHV